MATDSSTYLLVIRESSPETYQAMSFDERRQALERWNGWCDELTAQGKLLSGNPLAPQARMVSRASGAQVDGPFAEAKELIGGYLLLAAASLDEAAEIARHAPSLQYGMTIEVRPIAAVCHLAHSLGWRTMRGPEPAAHSA